MSKKKTFAINSFTTIFFIMYIITRKHLTMAVLNVHWFFLNIYEPHNKSNLFENTYLSIYFFVCVQRRVYFFTHSPAAPTTITFKDKNECKEYSFHPCDIYKYFAGVSQFYWIWQKGSVYYRYTWTANGIIPLARK